MAAKLQSDLAVIARQSVAARSKPVAVIAAGLGPVPAMSAAALPPNGGKKAAVQVMVRMTAEEGAKLDRIAAGVSRSDAFRLLLAKEE